MTNRNHLASKLGLKCMKTCFKISYSCKKRYKDTNYSKFGSIYFNETHKIYDSETFRGPRPDPDLVPLIVRS